MEDRNDLDAHRRSVLGRILEETAVLGSDWTVRYFPEAGTVVVASARFICELPVDLFESDFTGTVAVMVARMTGVDPQNVYNECQTDADRFDGWRWRRAQEYWHSLAV